MVRYKLCGTTNWSSSGKRRCRATRCVFSSKHVCGCSGQGKKNLMLSLGAYLYFYTHGLLKQIWLLQQWTGCYLLAVRCIKKISITGWNIHWTILENKLSWVEPQPHIVEPQPHIVEPQPHIVEPQPHIVEPQPHIVEPQPHIGRIKWK